LNDKDINVNINDFSFEVESVNNICFIDNFGIPNNQVIEAYAYIQKIDEEQLLNKILKEFDEDIEAFKIIEETAQCKKYGDYYSVVELGDGTGNLIAIVSKLFQSKDGYLFIDEVENGFHYTFLDKLWEIILTISKKQNVQVFATTHSKECIDSLARASEKLEDGKDISFIELGKNKENKLSSIVYPYDWFTDEISQNHEVRGW